MPRIGENSPRFESKSSDLADDDVVRTKLLRACRQQHLALRLRHDPRIEHGSDSGEGSDSEHGSGSEHGSDSGRSNGDDKDRDADKAASDSSQ